SFPHTSPRCLSTCLTLANFTMSLLRCQPEARAISAIQEDPLQIGIAVTGRMGAAIAALLLDRGHAVMVWNRTADKTKALAAAGAVVTATPRSYRPQPIASSLCLPTPRRSTRHIEVRTDCSRARCA